MPQAAAELQRAARRQGDAHARHLEGRLVALIDVWGRGPSPATPAADGAATVEHEVADIDVARADRPDVPTPEVRHDEEPEVREPLDLDALMPAEVLREAQTEANVEVETAPSQPIEEANLIDEAAAMIAAASEAAAANETAVDREADPEPAPEAPAELETLVSDPDTQPEPPAVAATGPIVFAAARRHVFVVYQASETVADDAPLELARCAADEVTDRNGHRCGRCACDAGAGTGRDDGR